MSPEVEAIGLGIGGAAFHGRRHLGGYVRGRLCVHSVAQHRAAQFLHDGLRDVFLHREDVVKLAVVGFRPEVGIRRDLDQLRGDAYTIAGLAHTAFEHGGHVEFVRDRRNVDVGALEGERGRARGDAQAANLGEHVQQLFRQPVGEVLVVLVATHVDERQHGDRWCCLVRQRGPRPQRRESTGQFRMAHLKHRLRSFEIFQSVRTQRLDGGERRQVVSTKILCGLGG